MNRVGAIGEQHTVEAVEAQGVGVAAPANRDPGRLKARAAEVAGAISDACAWGASEHGCDVDVRIEELFRGYELPPASPALGFAEAGLRGAGLEPVRVAIGGGSDANALRLGGFDCVLLANGTDAVHTAEEMVPARNLEKMLEVCEGIVAAVAAA